MADLRSVVIIVNGTEHALTYNSTTGDWEGSFAAPSTTSHNLSGGYYPVTVKATDQAGNVTTVDATHATLGAALRLVVEEVTSPTVTITAPAANAYVTNSKQPITFRLRDETGGSGIDLTSLRLKVDNGSALTSSSAGMVCTAVSGGYDCTYTPATALSEGSHTVAIDVSDNDGNAATTTTRTFKVDTVVPSLTVTAPASGANPMRVAAYTVAGTASDVTSPPVTVAVKLNNVDQGAVTVAANGSWSKAVTLAEGSNTIAVTATDKAGKTTTVTRTIVLDTVPPTISKVVITPNPVKVGQQYTIKVTVTDN